MTDDKMISERDAVVRERAAYARGRCMFAHELHDDEPQPCGSCRQRASEVYPLPKVKRLRVVMDDWGLEWRYVASDDRMQWRHGKDEWQSTNAQRGILVTPTRVALWADLLKNPTELVDADD